MKKVTKEEFDDFYGDNVGELNRSPEYEPKDDSITWYYELCGGRACKISNDFSEWEIDSE